MAAAARRHRDEDLARFWEPPAEHWPNLPGVTGGRDTLAGGTWLAFNPHGVVAGVLNRTGSLGPEAGKRSRGDLPLMALRHPTAAAAAADLATLDAADWRSFNLVIADRETAFFLRGLGAGPVTAMLLPPGLHMVTAADPNDAAHPRLARHLPRFQAAAPPDPPDWSTWPTLLADAEGPPEAALRILPQNGFATASAMLLATAPGRCSWRFWEVGRRSSVVGEEGTDDR